MSVKEKWVPKVGDRVAIYGNSQTAVLNRQDSDRRKVGKIVTIHDDQWLQVSIDGKGTTYTFHRRLCSPLKPPKTRREFWVNVYENGARTMFAHHTKENADRAAGSMRTDCILVREVRK